MKKIYITSVFVFVIVFGIFGQQFPLLQYDTSIESKNCNINGHQFAVSLQNEILTGDNVALNINLPGTMSDTCSIDISISYSSPNNKLNFVSSPAVSFNQSGGTLTTSQSLPGNDGQNFNLWFRFPNHITCDTETATISVTFNTCLGSCSVTLDVVARADNYWIIKKEYVTGDLVCGTSLWKITVQNFNPNPSGHGNYLINGTISENVSLPVLSGATHNISTANYAVKYVTLQNCQNTGTAITNFANYNFTLGDDCGIMSGTIQATSDPLQSPNASISFVKDVYSPSGYMSNNQYHISNGCKGRYRIIVHNNGNVPWQINSITDNFPSGITIDGISDNSYLGGYQGIEPNMWVTCSPNSLGGTSYTFNPNPNFILNPGQTRVIYIYFTVNAPINSIVSNTAYINFNANNVGSSGSGNSTQCQGITCPTLNTAIHNDSATVDFKVISQTSKELLKKCIINMPPGNIYNIGDIIKFRLQLYNSGSGNLNTTIYDNLSPPNQNLQVIPGSLSYSYFENNPIYTGCGSNLSNPQPISFTINPNISNPQNPFFDIIGMPGTCEYNKANILVIEFDAIIGPQMYGGKTNTATTSNNSQASANYTVDQYGVLEVNKYADHEFVENGDPFNFIIEVTNSGSVPLDSLIVIDRLPGCVRLHQGIQVSDALGNPVNFTTSGNLQINIDPAYQLNPSETLQIIIPVTKLGGGQCCNETVTAQGTMTTSGNVLEANYGDAMQPAACVKSAKCCDIEGFDARLFENSDGSYSLQINGGSVPIQELSVQMMDYHFEYNNDACNPGHLTNVGVLSTNTQLLDSLVLDNNTNNTWALNWGLGQPSVLQQTTIRLDINKPGLVDLECCNVDFDFCLKITAKDVNCNQCEWIVCPEEKPEPCEISVSLDNDSYCLGDEININWASNNTSGDCVNVYLVDSNNNLTQIASGLSANGNMAWIIPSDLKCDTTWKIAVADCESPKECFDIKDFYVKCCNRCNCDRWKDETINVSLSPMDDLDDYHHEKNYLPSDGLYKGYRCGDTINLQIGKKYTFKSPTYVCNPERSCPPSYKWKISKGNMHQTLSGNPINWKFTQYGLYKFTLIPSCGGKECPPCVFYVNIKDCDEDCKNFENFEQYNLNDPAGWNVINAYNDGVLQSGNNKFIQFRDGSGSSFAYKNFTSPKNLLSEGCALKYDLSYSSGQHNSPSTDQGIIIYAGSSPAIGTNKFMFKLNPSISSGSGFVTIEVPLKQATGGQLPGNSFGQWIPLGSTSPNDFNFVITNASGIAFYLDEGANPAEVWKFDNFCFKNCCKRETDINLDQHSDQ
jgi:uncharacterized repeat protein (TIGR01451 family)